ncbi:MAG: sugar phosphate isomerase/epimerase [Clostridia bacterium]|nr:sugar phosphate isomerase/epimerase [Clostridia bacterium]
MKTSTEINSIAKIVGEEEAVRLVAEAGFDAYDFSMTSMARFDWKNRCVIPTDHPLRSKDYLAFVKKIRRIAEENGISCNQSHAPFPVSHPQIREMLPRALECTAEAGGEHCVIHPDNNKPAAENAEMFFELLPIAHACGVKIATENMFNWNKEEGRALPAACSDGPDFLEHLRAVDDPFLVACVDVGHAEMAGLGTSAVRMLRELGPRVEALHLHDNDLRHDSHQLPFTMQIDFDPIVDALVEIGYRGCLTLEAVKYCAGTSPEELPARVREMSAAARRLDAMFTEKEKKRHDLHRI